MRRRGLLEDGASYSDLSVRKLIDAAGIARSTFYVYYEDKGELLRAMVADITEDQARAGARWFTLGPEVTHKRAPARITPSPLPLTRTSN